MVTNMLNDFAHYKATNPIAQLKEIQSNRRHFMLEEQRRRRNEEFSYLQDLKKIVPHINITREADDENFRRDLSKNLMMSEWMMEEPQDLEDFILVPTPKGTRGTLIYENPEQKMKVFAKVYAKTGHKLFEVRTNIPMDTILDIIWVKKNNTIYILDCMKYQGRDMTNCDTAFRRYWIGSKFFECRLGVIDVKLPNNNMKLNFIDGYEFSQPHRIHRCFQHIPCFPELGAELDGFLFYHKDASYTPGETPLVLWLFPYMVDEVLTMFRVHPDYNSLKPDGYTTYLEQIEKFQEKQNHKKEKLEQSRRRNLDRKGNGGRGNSDGMNAISFEDEDGQRNRSGKPRHDQSWKNTKERLWSEDSWGNRERKRTFNDNGWESSRNEVSSGGWFREEWKNENNYRSEYGGGRGRNRAGLGYGNRPHNRQRNFFNDYQF